MKEGIALKLFYTLLIFFPITVLARYVFHADDSVVFTTSCLAIIPLAVLIGKSTEQISVYTGPMIGGFLNATMGNIPELVISGFAIKSGLYTFVLASLSGSIFGNILVGLGLSIFIGGLKNKSQKFSTTIMRSNFILLAFAAFSMIMPFAFKHFGKDSFEGTDLKSFSLVLAVIMLTMYIIGMVFTLFTNKDIDDIEGEDEEIEEEAKWSLRLSIGILAITTIAVVVMSNTLVDTVEVAATKFGLSEGFIGIILMPILGNVAENVSAIIMAYKNKLNLSIGIAAGSSMQIALFVTPIMVIFSAILGDTMELIYTPEELIAIIIGIIMVAFVLMDKKTNWLEGLQLFAAYIILGVAFFMFV